MPAPRQIAVIDIGKTNAKLVLLDAQTHEQLAVRSTPNTVLGDDIYPHADVERLWAFILGGLKELQACYGVDGISITTHGATAALVAHDQLALPVLDYEHAGPEETALEYAAVRPEFNETLSPRLPNGLNLGAQIFWQSRAFSDRFAEVTHILTYPQYWAWRLTGVAASEVTSLGCHTDLWVPNAGRFSSLVVEMGWQPFFPNVMPAATVLGTLLPDIAEQTGLSAETPVACGIHDSNSSLVPHLGAHEAPFTIVSSGTWTICMTVGGDTAGLDAERDSLANVDAFGRPVPTARFMGGREFDMLVPNAAEPSDADNSRVVSDAIQARPSFVPGVGPFPHLVGRWTHDEAQLSAGERTAAVSLYLALVTQACLSLCGLGREIIIEGPLARNRLYAQALARLTGVPVRISADATGTSLGAMMLFKGAAHLLAGGEAVAPLELEGFEAYASHWRQTVRPH
ncbi:FGGY-family carbohydrate kinase [Devosia sp. RR2S18]|uniref:FGGY-family carbohydrate kinase n=1 Tax=Devosia rhizosphaerae TaxID=3049774 RepID=UPI002541BC84|nr:FGGY family carbohydrate kinase [Devosia sp. RR2S18]WIJ24340.1 FGGY family carbohydrate kinase [Devosia sp. RR2S18]